MLRYLILPLLLTFTAAHAQRDKAIKERVFQLSLVPALGTNGVNPEVSTIIFRLM